MIAGCDEARRELSAYLDGEMAPGRRALLERHLRDCPGCRDRLRDLAVVRSSIRISSAEPMPDLTPRIMERVEHEGPRLRRRDRVVGPLRTFGIAAAIAALLVAGAGSPWRDTAPDVASAGEIVAGVAGAARQLEEYRASFHIVEHGWHPEVPERRFRAEVWFSSPESFRLEIDDLTRYPAGESWPAGDVSFLARPGSAQVREPSRCPVAALPGCPSGGREVRTLVRRAPFDGRVILPTDIVVPLSTISGAGSLEPEGSDHLAGRPAQRVRLPLRDGVPLIASLQQGGSWRSFHPLDQVVLWLDEETWFPLGFDVIAGDSPERRRWAASRGYRDAPGAVLFRVRARDFHEPVSLSPRLFRIEREGLVTTGDFRSTPGRPRIAVDPAELDPYRSGRAGDSVIEAYASGTMWLRVVLTPAAKRPPATDDFESEEVDLGDGSYGYYRPAGPEQRRVLTLFGNGRHALIESNLPRADLLRIASRMDLQGRRLPRVSRAPGGVRIERIPPARARSAFLIGWLPRGYDRSRPDTALRVRSPGENTTLVLQFRAREAEYDGHGIRVTTWRARSLPPSSGAPIAIEVGDVGRYFADRGELEWISNGRYYSVRAPSLDLATLLRVARSVR